MADAVAQYYVRWGTPWRMTVSLMREGVFQDGREVYAYVIRSSDGAFFNFTEYANDPNSSNIWAQRGSLPTDLTQLRGQLTQFSLGSIPLFYERQWNFPENRSGNVDVESYQIIYYNPGEFGLIDSELINYVPASVSYQAVEARPVTQNDITAVVG